jgi:hypothetical protein
MFINYQSFSSKVMNILIVHAMSQLLTKHVCDEITLHKRKLHLIFYFQQSEENDRSSNLTRAAHSKVSQNYKFTPTMSIQQLKEQNWKRNSKLEEVGRRQSIAPAMLWSIHSSRIKIKHVNIPLKVKRTISQPSPLKVFKLSLIHKQQKQVEQPKNRDSNNKKEDREKNRWSNQNIMQEYIYIYI